MLSNAVVRNAAEKKSTSSVVVDGSAAQHGIVLNLGAAKGRTVSGNNNQLGCERVRTEQEELTSYPFQHAAS